MNTALHFTAGIGLLALTGCVSVGPDYAKPATSVPTAYKSLTTETNLGSGKQG